MLYELQNVSLRRQHGDSAFELVVRDLSILHGEFSFVVGESGCGKSTLLDALALLLRPVDADVFEFTPQMGGRSHPVKSMGEGRLLRLRRQHMGHVLQSGGLIPSFSVRDNILLSSTIAGARFSPQWWNEVIERLGLGDCLRRKPSQLSGGQRQRVAIARAVLHRPAVILADEPTAAVDQPRAFEICEIFHSLTKESGCTVIMVTHNHDLANHFADRILPLETPVRHGEVSRSEICWT